MNFKIIISLLGVIALTAGLLFAINLNKADVSLNKSLLVKSENYLRCEALVAQINDEINCDKKWEIFNQEFSSCETIPPTAPTETEIETFTFRDVIFNIAECFVNEKKNEKALAVYNQGLKYEDWMKDDHFNTYSAHFLIKRGQQLNQPPKNNKCYNEKTFQAEIEMFARTKKTEVIRGLMYGDDVLDTQVMGSDAGGYLSFNQWNEVFVDTQESYNLSFLKKAGNNCFITLGWDQDYPWRAFCAEQKGEKNCLYLMTIYAGIKSTLGDFEEFKKQNPE